MKGVFVTQHFSTFTSFISFTMHTGTNGSKMGPGHFFFISQLILFAQMSSVSPNLEKKIETFLFDFQVTAEIF